MPEILGKEVGPVAFGLMGFTWRPKVTPDEQAFKTMKAALASGSNFWNGGEFYGTPEENSLTLLERYFTKYPEDADKVVLSIKGGYRNGRPDGSPEGIRASVDNCLKLLNGKKKLDIFESARVDKNTPIEVTLKVLEEEYVKTGKLGGISLSEVSAATIAKAARVTKIVAVEVELSLWSTDVLSNGVAQACALYNIPLLAYSPIGRGMLSGEIRKPEDIPEGDFRRFIPRFNKENFGNNLKLVEQVASIAKKSGYTPAQLAIGWVRSHSRKDGNPEIIPLPGATTVERVKENSANVSLSKDDLAAIDSFLASFVVAGTRYGEAQIPDLEG